MSDQRKMQLEALSQASPLEISSKLAEFEMHDKKSSQQIIDEVYGEFNNGGNLTNSVLKPVFLSVIDGLLEATPGGREARKKGLTASRVLQECEQFSYDHPEEHTASIDGYSEFKNAREHDITNSNMTQKYDKDIRNRWYEDKSAMINYKLDRVRGEKMLADEYTGKQNLYLRKDNPHQSYNDDSHRKQAQPDHIVPLKTIHDELKRNYALDDSDIKRIANIEDNLAVTSAKINQVKKDMSNVEYIKKYEASIDKQTAANMVRMQKEAERAIDKKSNEVVRNNLLGKSEVNIKTLKDKIEKFENETGKKLDLSEKEKIVDQLRKEKTKEIHKNLTINATEQAKDTAVGNLMLFIVKPLYYEMKDIFRKGMTGGVGASGIIEALGIRFKRVINHLIANAAAFFGDNIMEFVKNFISSLIEGIISLFVGIFKQVLKLIKEGIKIFIQSAKILFGKEGKEMTPAQKGDAIIKLIGGSVIAISGIGIEVLLNKIGIVEPWSIVISTMLSGIASALFMFLLDKIDLFSTKADLRKERIEEIFNERIRDINETAESFNVVAIETLRKQYRDFEDIKEGISAGLKNNDLDVMNQGLYRMANLYKIDLPYKNTKEFVSYFDSTAKLEF